MRTYDELSIAEKVARLPQVERDAISAGYTQDEFASLDFDWNFWGPPEQLAPPGTWDNWLILAGRGLHRWTARSARASGASRAGIQMDSRQQIVIQKGVDMR